MAIELLSYVELTSDTLKDWVSVLAEIHRKIKRLVDAIDAGTHVNDGIAMELEGISSFFGTADLYPRGVVGLYAYMVELIAVQVLDQVALLESEGKRN